MTEPSASAAEVARLVRDRRVAPRTVVAAALARISERDGRVGAFVRLRPVEALAEAEALGRRRSLDGLQLAGVPVAVKDNVAVAGQPVGNGTVAGSGAPAAADHEVVRRLRAAGAIVVGQTRVSELCIFASADDAAGITGNPWDLARSAGGSSGGSAAAVAAGMVPIAHGADGLGSVRIPAACCGVLGGKPGAGTVGIPVGDGSWYGMAEHGALGTTVADVALLLAVLAGRPDLAGVAAPPRLRVGVSRRPPLPGLAVDRHLLDALRAAAGGLRDAGHRLDLVEPPYGPMVGAAAAARWVAGAAVDADGLDERRLQPRTRTHVRLGRAVRRLGLVDEPARRRWRQAVTALFDRYDVLLTPALARVPPPALSWSTRGWLANVASNIRYAPFAAPWNLAGLPALVVPAGVHPYGLPAAVQLVGPPGGEAALLATAGELERRRPWRRHAPGYG